MRKVLCATTMALLLCITGGSQVFKMVKDIIPNTTGSNPNQLTDVNGTLYFVATTSAAGEELWKSNGTSAGTVLVKDINPGVAGSAITNLTNVNGTLFFRANDGTSGDELWKSDGTTAGTMLVKDITFGASASGNTNFVNIGGILYFTANNKNLWKSDGTTAGTVMIRGFTPSLAFPSAVTQLGSSLYFSVIASAPAGRELWKTDGTTAGTVFVSGVTPGDDVYVANIINVNNALYFRANGDPPASLWKSDGTAAGTVLVKDVGLLSRPIKLNNNIYFPSWQSGNNQLWMSDGSSAGTVILKQFPSSSPTFPLFLTPVNNTLFFVSDEATHGTELWKSNGTAASTVLVKDINSAGASSSSPNALADINGTLLFSADDGVHGREIWKSDGTAAGTVMVQDINNPGDASPDEFVISGSRIFVTANTAANGRELWSALLTSLSPLPLTLLDFKAELANNDGLLNWKTGFEENTSHFDIERSIDNREYKKIGELPAANITGGRQYNFVDPRITAIGVPVVYYRLKMNDMDGKSTYSKIIAVDINSKHPVIMLYPSPVQNSATLMIAVKRKENLIYSIVDQSGKILQQKSIVVNAGSNMITIVAAPLSAGSYTILVRGDGISEQVRFLKQ